MFLIPLILGFVCIALMLWRRERVFAFGGRVIGVAALFSAGLILFHPTGILTEDVMFMIFAGVAVAAAVCMVVSRNPVYAALWFALVTLCVCCLFVLQAAPFLAAATMIVYAGAIIVTFLFVIMLARQSTHTGYDQRPTQPMVATVVAFILLGISLGYLQDWRQPALDSGQATAKEQFLPATASLIANPLSKPAEDERLGTMRGLGRSLFGDYLFAVEVAGTLLLVAAIAAIAIAPKRLPTKA